MVDHADVERIAAILATKYANRLYGPCGRDGVNGIPGKQGMLGMQGERGEQGPRGQSCEHGPQMQALLHEVELLKQRVLFLEAAHVSNQVCLHPDPPLYEAKNSEM